MWPNGALSDLIRSWKTNSIGESMKHYRDRHCESGLVMFWTPDAIADAIERGQKAPHIKKLLEAMYDTEWEDQIRDWSLNFVSEQYGPELGDLCLLQNLVHFI